jgi:hypothetical protein
MAFVLRDRVRESSTTTGTGSITTAGAAGGYQPFSAVMNIGDTCWYAIVMPGSSWETGLATYTAANTLARTTVLESSNAGALVSFAAGSKDVFLCQPASQAQPAFPSGTLMLFQQTAAPMFWTKQAVHNDKALRVVSGTASSGGTNAFSTVNNQTVSVNNTTITVSTMASHAHSSNASAHGSDFGVGTGANDVPEGIATINANGGDGAHSHGITIAFAVAYVDLIICAKD